MNDEPPRPSASNEELPAAVDSVIARAMAKEPADRYGSGIELVDAIREATAASRSWLGGRRLVALAALLAILVTAAAVPAILLTGGGAGGPTITTVAGVGLPGSSGDGGLATNAQLLPVALAFDTEGQLYVTDQPGRVRRVGERGFIKTVAGTGGSGYSGDGGPVTEAEIGLAPSLATDADGNLYLVQYDAAALRLVSPEGRITTVARDLCKSPGSAVVTAASIIYLVCEDNIVAGSIPKVGRLRSPAAACPVSRVMVVPPPRRSSASRSGSRSLLTGASTSATPATTASARSTAMA